MAIVGMIVTLVNRVQVGIDPLNEPIYEELETEVENVLIGPVSATDLIDNTSLTGAKAIYTLAIPKSDENEWENALVKFWGHTWKTVGLPTQGMDDNIPLYWNKKVVVERYG